MLYDRAKKECDRIKKRINLLQNKIKKFPEGKIICSRNGNGYKWEWSDGHNKKSIRKADRKFAEQLAIKKYCEMELADLQHEKMAIEFYLRHHDPNGGKADNMLLSSPGYQELIHPYFKSKSQELSEWASSPYEKNEKYPEQLIHKASTGKNVRSKSEAMIDMFLYRNSIPFRYECALQLGDITFYPDFTIRHPKTGEIYYWEHFGKMDYLEYSKNTFSKMQIYTQYGIVPSVHLIVTYETKNFPLSYEMIEKIIEYYFL